MNSVIGIGLCRENSPHTGMPGWKRGSWAYHGDDGQLFLENGRGREFGDLYRAGDVVGCGANIDTDELFFTKNGTWIGSAGKSLHGKLFAVVGIGCETFHLSANFSPGGFMYSL